MPLASLLAATASFAAALGAPEPAAQPSVSPSPVPSIPADSVTHHSIVLGGRTIAYTATAGTITLRSADEAPTASMFYAAYVEENAPARRPVTFFFNGGPGSATIWLHLGAFGPRRVVAGDAAPSAGAPYKFVENEYSLLDRTDLVFIDAPGTGFSRLLGKSEGKDFYGIDQDAAAFGQFVRRYLTQNNRWNSPKFLFGESYGTTRACALAGYLHRHNLDVNGIVLLSSALNLKILFEAGDGNDVAYFTYLPTETAVAWYHHKLPNATSDFAGLLRSSESFATGEYATALAKGSSLSGAERAQIAHKLHDFTGISESYILRSNLRVDPNEFEKQVLGSGTRVTGRFDARFVGVAYDPNAETPEYDPSYTYLASAYLSTFNEYVRTDLGYHTDAEYQPLRPLDWDFRRKDQPTGDVLPDLTSTLTEDPRLRVFSANGYYDMATPFFQTEFLLDHMGLDPSLASHIEYGFYEAGHMLYVHPSSLAAFKRDLDRWYDGVLALP
ncbi:MAG: peptidase S10 [Candidatus Eremiobacteraeota bacterium]|nr:peptidase S10 [Candidatus Eremiobacteraeota bacterium]